MSKNLSQEERAELAALRRKPEKELTPAERVKVFGTGNANRMMYAKNPSGAGLITREFQPEEKIPEGWKDTPAAFGIETEPALAPDGALPENAFNPPHAVKVETSEPTDPKGKKAA